MTANEYAVSQGFRTACELPPWRGFRCYEAIYGGIGLDDVPMIGYPQIILERKGTYRMATMEETLAYMAARKEGEGDGDD